MADKPPALNRHPTFENALEIMKSKGSSSAYNKDSKVGEMVASASDNSILTNTGSTALSGPILKLKVP